ncbi:MAG TPA: carboxy terminal-processing peptidase [Kofleriaceae bacterium]|jgi:carboxyl-terminal processing protease|nr:carboxy terminal-processing peptidase [Kofleriaceae bacterium]
MPGLRAVLAVLSLVLAACSAKAPASAESRPATPEVKPAAPAAAAAPAPALDPRETTLSAAVVLLLEHEHLLRKPIDDELSRTAFDTYLDRLDAGKMFLLRKDRDALARYGDKIDDELRSGSLDLAHEGERIFESRVEVVEKLVAELLAAPMNHDDEEWIEIDPKKVEVATTEQELRDRWRRRLELEVLERVAQMEARLEADAAHKVGLAPGKSGADKAAAGKSGGKRGVPDVRRKTADARGVHGSPQTAGVGSGAQASVAGIDAPQPGDSDRDAETDDEPRTPLAQIPPTPEARDAKARTDLAKTYAARFTRLRHPGPFDPASELINAVASSLDPHTTYLPPADKANFDIRMSGSLEGIGALLREHDDYVEVVEIVPGGASWRHGGLAPGDLILSVAQNNQDPIDTVDMRLDDVVKMIRGPKGTVVTLRIQRPTGEQQSIAITRDVVVVEESYARGAVLNRKGQRPIGYIHLPSFYGGRGPGQRTSGHDVAKLLDEMKALKVGGVVLDIRGNGGGLLGEAVTMTGALIDRGPVVQVQDNRGNRETYSDDQPGTDYDGPVVVLVDRFSASASEILAGALQDYHRAVIVGTGPTHGKGTVQTLAELDRVTRSNVDLGVLKITVQQFFRVSGSSTQREGVTPDILLPDPAAHIETGERTLDHAIPWSQIPAVDHDSWPASWKTAALVERSATRVAKQPVLAKMAALTQVLKASRDDTRIPLERTAWDAHRKKQRAAFDAASPDLKAAPLAFTVKSLDDPNLPPPGPGGSTRSDPLARWRESVARDPWIEECANVLGDMAK